MGSAILEGWYDAVGEDFGRGDRSLAVVEFGEGDLGVGIDHRLLVDPPDALRLAPRHLVQRDLAALVVKLLEAIEAVA